MPTRRTAFVSPETMKTWAVILADPNPIHLDREAVRASGLGDRLINQGPINIAYVQDMLQAAFPDGAIVSFKNRFIDNVFEGDTLDATGTVIAKEQKDQTTLFTCDFALTAQERGVVLSGQAVVCVRHSGDASRPHFR